MRYSLALFVVFVCGMSSSCHTRIPPAIDRHQAIEDSYCNKRGQALIRDGVKLSRVEAFYSWKTHTCVQIEVDTSISNWSYTLRDVSAGFFQLPKVTYSEGPVTISHDEEYGIAHAEGYWIATDSSENKQLVSTIVADIQCNKSEHICREADATLFAGLLKPQTEEFKVTSWTSHGIVADDEAPSMCGINHRLSIDFDSPGTVVTDYPTKTNSTAFCKGFQTANSYSLHGGSVSMLTQNQIFSCDKDGADSAILSNVEKLNGDVENEKYEKWLDNGESGPPRTIKTPDHPYTQGKCSALMEKKLAELRQD